MWYVNGPFLARDEFVNRRAIAMMFVRSSVWDRGTLWSYGAC